MDKLTYTTAIVVIPPAGVWPAIQAIRTKHDAKVRRWMPHITLMYPCVPMSEFSAAQERLGLACRDLPAFGIELADFRTFRHRGGNDTIWLAPKPEAGLIELQAVVQRAALGEQSASGRRQSFQPHLSVGQVQGNIEIQRLVAELQAAWQPVRFSVTGISLIWRREPPNDVFQVAATVSLAGEGVGGVAERCNPRLQSSCSRLLDTSESTINLLDQAKSDCRRDG
ncbi:MAG: 2'-5' RNA ligase family protein [Planctomycetota bacterium]|nr:2'-5' RNA ligase family protein [Planctomycetota bacterium]